MIMVVDTAIDEHSHSDDEQDALLERVLSVAATAIDRISRHGVHIRLFVTRAEPTAEFSAGGDVDALMIRLAEASLVSTAIAQQTLRHVAVQHSNAPALILTSRSSIADHGLVWPSAAVMHVGVEGVAIDEKIQGDCSDSGDAIARVG